MNGHDIEIRGIEQGRARYAFDQVNGIATDRTLDDGLRKKYKSGAKKLPVLIQTNGLGQTLAFINNRDDGYKKLYAQIGDWLAQKELITDGRYLVEEVIAKGSNEYRQITTETISLLMWMRRFVDGLMPNVQEEN
jgi:CRISPR-associated protein Cmr5